MVTLGEVRRGYYLFSERVSDFAVEGRSQTVIDIIGHYATEMGIAIVEIGGYYEYSITVTSDECILNKVQEFCDKIKADLNYSYAKGLCDKLDDYRTNCSDVWEIRRYIGVLNYLMLRSLRGNDHY